MLADTAGDAVPDQSNPRVIIFDELPEDDETSHRDQLLGNPFTGPGDMVAGPYGHGGALSPSQSWGSGDKGEDFCTMVQTLEGIIPLPSVTPDNDPHSEVSSTNNYAILKGGYPAPYVPENFQGLFLPKPGAPGILTCGYQCTILRDHPLHCQGPFLHRRQQQSQDVSHLAWASGSWCWLYRDSMHSKERGGKILHRCQKVK